jgi:lipopolysaccharide export system protein LptC
MIEKKRQRHSQHAAVLRSQQLTSRLKKIFPVLISLIVLFLFLWPQIKAFWITRLSTVHEKTTVTKMTHEGELVEPHYFATSKAGEPFELRAKSAYAINTQEADLEEPSGQLLLKSGKTLSLKANRAVYHQADQVLYLKDKGVLQDTDGNVFHFITSTFLLKDSRVFSGEPVTGHGPLGSLEAKGFDISENGARSILRGHSMVDRMRSLGEGKPPITLHTHGGEVLTAQGDMIYERGPQTVRTQHDVELNSPKGLVRADQMVAYLKSHKGKLTLDHVDAVGHVFVETADGTITGDRGTYFASNQTALIKGNVEVKRQSHYARGTEVEADFKTGESRLKSPGQEQGRQVRIVIDAEQIGPTKEKE